MPINFAQAMLFIPSTLVGFSNTETAQGLAKSLSNAGSMIYNIIYAILVIGFTYLYTALIFNPTQMADDLKRNNGFIPGIKPGQDTADYIGAIMDRITLPGAIFLALIGIMPGVAGQLHITQGFASFYGGTSMLIMVGVVLDTLQQIESQLLMRHYDGLMKTGRITGRQAVSAGV
jgi:preprotein translocase subunit SecY